VIGARLRRLVLLRRRAARPGVVTFARGAAAGALIGAAIAGIAIRHRPASESQRESGQKS
jgi:hypothetical protein